MRKLERVVCRWVSVQLWQRPLQRANVRKLVVCVHHLSVFLLLLVVRRRSRFIDRLRGDLEALVPRDTPHGTLLTAAPRVLERLGLTLVYVPDGDFDAQRNELLFRLTLKRLVKCIYGISYFLCVCVCVCVLCVFLCYERILFIRYFLC